MRGVAVAAVGVRIVTYRVDTPKDTRVDELDRAARVRRAADLRLSMSERLARVHALTKQLSAIRGRARKP